MLDREKVLAFIKGAWFASNSTEVRDILGYLETVIECDRLNVKEITNGK